METLLRQVGGSILLVLVAAALVIGGIFLAMAESNRTTPPSPSITDVPVIITFTAPAPAEMETMIPILPAPTNTMSLLPTAFTQVSNSGNTPIPCGHPVGYIQYTVQAGDTIFSISHAYGLTIAQLQQANCRATGDYYIVTGQHLWVPNVITRTPLATRTETLTPVSIIFPTLTLSPTPTYTPTITPSPTLTPTATLTSTHTNTVPPPTPTNTDIPTSTPP